MKAIEDIFYSFTFGGETLSIAAAIATIKEIENKKVIPYLWKIGTYLQKNTNKLIKRHGLSDAISVRGKPCLQEVLIEDTRHSTSYEIRSFIQQELIQQGILWLGQHNLSFSHTKKDMDFLLSAYDEIFKCLQAVLDTGTLKKHLEGEPITNIFKVR